MKEKVIKIFVILNNLQNFSENVGTKISLQ